MILDLDIGNSRITWLLSKQEHEMATDSENKILAGGHATELAELNEVIDTKLKEHKPTQDSVQHIRVACVLQDKHKKEQLLQGLEKHWHIKPQLATTIKEHKGLTIAYADPTKLGVDRWLALLAAMHNSTFATLDNIGSRPSNIPEHQLIIDAGTATNIDLLSGSNHNYKHLGGLLIPGTHSIKEYFMARTQLSLVADGSGKHSSGLDNKWGTTSQSCLDLGVDGMFSVFIQHQVDEFFNDYPDGRVLISGGAGAAIYEELKPIPVQHKTATQKNALNITPNILYVSHLVCYGLAYGFD